MKKVKIYENLLLWIIHWIIHLIFLSIQILKYSMFIYGIWIPIPIEYLNTPSRSRECAKKFWNSANLTCRKWFVKLFIFPFTDHYHTCRLVVYNLTHELRSYLRDISVNSYVIGISEAGTPETVIVK